MKYLHYKRRKIAIGMLLVLISNLFAPSISYALTSGPAQPETQGFQPAGVSDMVDLSSGSFKYNIPLLDIDGYPINLNYASGSGMDDEASWVGLGWSLNPGAINRQVRGIPDDFAGDTVESDHYVKPEIVVGGSINAKYESVGIPVTGSVSLGIFNSNYTGIGAEIGANAGISQSFIGDGYLTAGLGLGVNSNTQSGASVTPSVNLAIDDHIKQAATVSAAYSASLGYNSRSGLKSLTLGSSFGVSVVSSKVDKTTSDNISYGNSYDVSGSTITYNTEPISPTIQIPFTTNYNSFSFNLGGAFAAQFPSLGGTGYRSVRQVATPVNIKMGYGFLYAEKGKNNPNAVMDFIREKDNPIVENIPNIALPIHTPDLWSYTNQVSSGQFRLYRGGSGVFFDNTETDLSTTNTDGFDLGLGAYFHGGLTLFKQTTVNRTNKWTANNNYLGRGDFQDTSGNPGREQVFFRQTGEKGLADPDIYAQTYGTQPLAVSTSNINANALFRTNSGGLLPEQPMAKTSRRLNRTVISYLTANEARLAGLDTAISRYALNTSTTNTYPAEPVPLPNDAVSHRVNAIRKINHISEITVTDDGGKRMVYGTPVYNITQDEYTFAVGATGRSGPGNTYPANNQVAVPENVAMNNLGIDNYYQRDHKGAYATSYLLTAILSPDYVDRTGNGISDDDYGTAIKFNYSRLSYLYKWRTPYQKATLNKGLLADPDDDKGSIVYGEKEIWYVHSIETKTKIAYFITAARNDDLGVLNWHDGGQDASHKQQYLKQIRLYSKADMSTPIKVVNFSYTYTLCPGIPNNSTGGGKLTLSKVWFDYGNSAKGQHFPYTFTYNTTANGATVNYGYMVTDRWGKYKTASENPNSMPNDQYPYSDQNATAANQNAALWQLSKIQLPTEGAINVSYESGDYAYVQNQKAMQMVGIPALLSAAGAPSSASQLNIAHGLRVNIPVGLTQAVKDTTQWFKDTYLDGSDFMYTKLYVHLATGLSNSEGCNYDYVPCYAEVKKVSLTTAGAADVIFVDNTDIGKPINPISIAAWQALKNEYPRYAYSGFDNRVQSSSNSVTAAVSAIINAAKNMTELIENFYEKANSRNFAGTIDLSQSFVKITVVGGRKLGGSARVNKVAINDNWKSMSGNNITAESYGQSYTYTTTENDQVISSGVATYEPYVGNDENALKQPVPYTETIKGALSNYYDIEQPFGESLYPAPEVTYSKVTVNDLDQTGAPSNKTGYTVNEFYTTKDFPVKVTVMKIAPYHIRPAAHYSLTSTSSIDQMCLSQGYSIELNDMNAKPKSERILNESGSEISSTVYNYKVDSKGALDNHADVLSANGTLLPSQVIGQEVEFFTDFREQISNNTGNTINVGGDVFPVPFWPFFALPHNPKNGNNEVKTFRSACAVKVIQDYGLLDNVVKTENGSSITTQNIAYDGLTGEPVVTKTQNEFNRSIYSVNLPAYWAYAGMGGAYTNQGVYLIALKTNGNGLISSIYGTYLKGGDELVNIVTGTHYWIDDNSGIVGGGTSKRLIDSVGHVRTSAAAATYKIVRSGFRNMLSASASSVVCLNNPLVTTAGVTTLQLKLNANLSSLKIINASATTYDESWAGQADCTKAYAPRPITTRTGDSYKIFPGSVDLSYCDSGASIRQPSGPDIINTAAYWKNSLARAGIWVGPAPGSGSKDSVAVGYQVCINVPTAKTYYFGFSTDNRTRIYWDGTLIDTSNGFSLWYIRPHALTAGNHVLKVILKSSEGLGSGGLEIYSNSLVQLESPTITGTTNLFSTKNLINDTTVQNFNVTVTPPDTVYHYTYADGSVVNPCNPEIIQVPVLLNPYLTGFLGNWRPYQTKVFQQSRYNRPVTAATRLGADIKNAGTINAFFNYWYYGASGWVANPNGTKWVTANTVTLYDQYGQQLENVDALGRYSAAQFDFNGELPGAVATNSMNREIYASSFEDNKFIFGQDVTDTCYSNDFKEPLTGHTISSFSDSTMSHTGNYSVRLPTDGVTLGTFTNTKQQKTLPYLVQDNLKQYMSIPDTGLYPAGFQPSPNKAYLFDAWIYDGSPNTKTINITLTLNKTSVALKCRAVVEGWKLMEGVMNISSVPSGAPVAISIIPKAGVTVHIDDIRMHPFAAEMKTYAYDDKTMRLMAELDENDFATFYEYDDEGLLVRVKKETEKGVMTLKESRSSYSKQ
jgi:hypothetical protein